MDTSTQAHDLDLSAKHGHINTSMTQQNQHLENKRYTQKVITLQNFITEVSLLQRLYPRSDSQRTDKQMHLKNLLDTGYQ